MDQNKINLSQQLSSGDQNYVVPSELVPLPSRGVIYPIESPFHGVESVEIRAMTAKDEDILTSQALLKQNKAISSLLRSCVTNKAIDVESMLVGDRNALLVAIRISGYGAEYVVDVSCPNCDNRFEHSFDLSKLEIKRLGEQPVNVGENLFSFVCPSGRKVSFRLTTGNDDREMSVIMQQKKKAGLGGAQDSAVTSKLTQQIVSFDGEADRAKIGNMVRSMRAGDSRALRTHMDEISPGIDMKQMVTCPGCEQETEVDVPMGTEFFWPSR